MGKYINSSAGTLIVLGVKYKVGESFSLSDSDEKKISPAFLDQYDTGSQKKMRPKRTIAQLNKERKDKMDAEKAKSAPVKTS